MKYVHLKCLQQWRSRTENKKHGPHVTTYTWKAFHCELCKTKLSDTYQVGDKNFQIFKIMKPEKNYMVIETYQIHSNENDNEKQRQMHIIDFGSINRVRFGRGHETDVRIHDISVSRLHAVIQRDDQGRYFIEDNNAKFGTLVQIQAPMHLNENFEYSFQAGRSVFHINMQQEQSIFNFMKSQQPLQMPVYRDEFGKVVNYKESETESIATKKKRDQLIFMSYVGQFCNESSKNLLREAEDFIDENDEFFCPGEESIGDEHESQFNV